MAQRLLRLPAVLDRTGCSTTDVYKGMQAGTFPKSVAIGKRSRAWVEAEVDEWIKARVADRDEGRVRMNVPGPGRGRKGLKSDMTAEAAA